jgi:hypothetical protein
MTVTKTSDKDVVGTTSRTDTTARKVSTPAIDFCAEYIYTSATSGYAGWTWRKNKLGFYGM